MLYVSPSNITNQAANTQFTVNVQVANMQKILDWDVFVQVSDPTVIKPIGLSFATDMFETNYTGATLVLIASCISNVGQGCRNGVDRVGIAHSAASVFGTPSPPITGPLNGMLFVITFNVTASLGYSQIQILTSYTTLADGTTTPVPYTPGNGSYGSPVGPDFSVSASPAALSVIQGSSTRTEITISSILGFTGTVNLTASPEFTRIIGNQTLAIPRNGSNSTSLIMVTSSATALGSYVVTITAYNLTTTRSAQVSVSVSSPASFLLVINPGLIRVHGGASANSTIQVQGQQGFNGTVHLNLLVFTCTQSCFSIIDIPVPGLVASVGVQDIAIVSGSTESTSLNVTTPVSSLSFIYRVDVVATSGSISTTRSLLVAPPVASLSVNLNPVSLTIGAGNDTAVSVNVQSVDYFWGWVYVSAVMNGGTASFDKPNYHIALPNSAQQLYAPSANFTLTIKIFTGAIPGNYVVLLTVYSVETTPITLPNSLKISNVVPLAVQVAIPVQITDRSLYTVSPPAPLGLSPMIYFAILGALGIPFTILTVRAYRNYREDREDADWKL